MSILGIENRTENWKTAHHFAPFFSDAAARLRLAKRLGAPDDTSQNDVQIELFWKGMRDYLHANKREKPYGEFLREAVGICDRQFPDLRDDIKTFNWEGLKFRDLKPTNYRFSEQTKEALGNNLRNTEVDIVLQSGSLLFIGEAKEAAKLDGTSNRVLVHQLVRQFVMVQVLVELCENQLRVIPFVVREEPEGREQLQVKFMKEQEWLSPDNVLTWEQVGELTGRV